MKKLMLLLCFFAVLAVITIAATMPAMAWAYISDPPMVWSPEAGNETTLTDYPPFRGKVDLGGFVRPNKDDRAFCGWDKKVFKGHEDPLYCNQPLAYRQSDFFDIEVRVISVGKDMGGFATGLRTVRMETNPLKPPGLRFLSYDIVVHPENKDLFRPGNHLRILVKSWVPFTKQGSKLKPARNLEVHFQVLAVKPSS